MQADRHHLRVAGLSLSAQLVHAAAALVEEVGGAPETLCQDVAPIVVGEAVRDDQVALAADLDEVREVVVVRVRDRKSTRLNSSHVEISYAVFCLKKKTPFYK